MIVHSVIDWIKRYTFNNITCNKEQAGHFLFIEIFVAEWNECKTLQSIKTRLKSCA